MSSSESWILSVHILIHFTYKKYSKFHLILLILILRISVLFNTLDLFDWWNTYSHSKGNWWFVIYFFDRLFQRGISFVGKDYMCHTLWDKYIEFELSQQQWSSLTHIYIKALRFPTKKLRHYYNWYVLLF